MLIWKLLFASAGLYIFAAFGSFADTDTEPLFSAVFYLALTLLLLVPANIFLRVRGYSRKHTSELGNTLSIFFIFALVALILNGASYFVVTIGEGAVPGTIIYTVALGETSFISNVEQVLEPYAVDDSGLFTATRGFGYMRYALFAEEGTLVGNVNGYFDGHTFFFQWLQLSIVLTIISLPLAHYQRRQYQHSLRT